MGLRCKQVLKSSIHVPRKLDTNSVLYKGHGLQDQSFESDS